MLARGVVIAADVDEIVCRVPDDEVLGRHGGLEARDEPVADPAWIGARSGEGEGFGRGDVGGRCGVGGWEIPGVGLEAHAGGGADEGDVVESGDRVDPAAPDLGTVSDDHLGGRVSTLTFDFGGVMAPFVVLRAGFHAGFEADVELVRGRVDVGFTVGGGFAGGNPV